MKTRIKSLERRAAQIPAPADRITVVEVYGDRGSGRELLDVIRVRLVTDGNEDPAQK